MSWSTVHTFVKHCVLRRAVGCPSWNLENYSWTIIKHTCTGFLHKRSYTKVQEGLSKRVQTAFTLDIASSLMLQQMAATISHFHCRLQRNGLWIKNLVQNCRWVFLLTSFKVISLKSRVNTTNLNLISHRKSSSLQLCKAISFLCHFLYNDTMCCMGLNMSHL